MTRVLKAVPRPTPASQPCRSVGKACSYDGVHARRVNEAAR